MAIGPRSCILPGRSTHLVQELQVGTVVFHPLVAVCTDLVYKTDDCICIKKLLFILTIIRMDGGNVTRHLLVVRLEKILGDIVHNRHHTNYSPMYDILMYA